MPDFIKFLLFGVPILGVIVFVHELGHFIAARLVGVRVTVFSLGFGRRLVGFERGETDYRISLLPLGGYVKMAGDSIEEEREGAADEFLSRAWWERAFIAIAGPFANFVMAIFCAIVLFAAGVEFPLRPNVVGPVEPGSVAAEVGLQQGDVIERVGDTDTPNWHDVVQRLDEQIGAGAEARLFVLRKDGGAQTIPVGVTEAESLIVSLVPEIPAEVGQVTVGTPAYQAGLREGDRIVSVDGVAIEGWWDLRREVSTRPGQEITLVLERDGTHLERTITPADQDGVGLIGVSQVSQGTGVERYTLGQSIVQGTQYTVALVVRFVEGLGQLVTSWRTAGSNLAGPIAIVQMSAQQAEQGRTELLNWLIFVSVALMVMNLLPIPVLDGGHILVAVLEGVMRRPLGPRVMLAIWRAGMVFLLLLMTFAIANDGFKLVQRTRADRQVTEVEAPKNAAEHAEEQ